MDDLQQNPPTSSELQKVKVLVIDHYDQLHDIAARHMGRENSNHSLEVTGLSMKQLAYKHSVITSAIVMRNN